MRLIFAFVIVLLLGSCAVVPPLSEATGSLDSGLRIADIVTRVKCEIADSFEQLRGDPNFLWLRDWTVKADLTLQINAQAGVSPSGSYTKFQRNTFNFDAGSTSLTSNSIAAVQQFFTLSAAANFGEQAVRTEVVSFSLALDELHTWREELRRIEDAPTFGGEYKICSPGPRLELAGDLGLREWVLSAFFPVEEHDLLAGNHPPPGTAKPTPTPSAVSPPKPIPGPAAGEQPQPAPDEQWIKDIAMFMGNVKDAAQQTQASANTVLFTKNQIDAALKDALKMQRTYASVATTKIKKQISQMVETLELAARYAYSDAQRAEAEAKQAAGSLKDASDHYKDFMDNLKDGKPAFYKQDRDAVSADDTSTKTNASNAKLFVDHITNLQKNVTLLSLTPDPPIDSILHSVQFVVAFGASVTPSWTLLRWKGPGLNAPGASAQGVRTNILQLAFGPRAPNGARVSDEQIRLIQNATVLSTKPQ
jgi:hypothetical protein